MVDKGKEEREFNDSMRWNVNLRNLEILEREILRTGKNIFERKPQPKDLNVRSIIVDQYMYKSIKRVCRDFGWNYNSFRVVMSNNRNAKTFYYKGHCIRQNW